VYPENNWNMSKLDRTSIWDDLPTAQHFVEWLKKQEDEKILEYINKIIEKLSNKRKRILLQLLSESFPQYNWTFNSGLKSKKSQYVLRECLKTIFPGEGK
jgi:hypothetical protein